MATVPNTDFISTGQRSSCSGWTELHGFLSADQHYHKTTRIPRIRDGQHLEWFCLVSAIINSGFQSLCKSTSPLVYIAQYCHRPWPLLSVFAILSAQCQWSKCPDSILVHLEMCGLLSHYQTALAVKLKLSWVH